VKYEIRKNKNLSCCVSNYVLTYKEAALQKQLILFTNGLRKKQFFFQELLFKLVQGAHRSTRSKLSPTLLSCLTCSQKN